MEIGHMRRGSRPNRKHQSFSFRGRAVLFICLRTFMVYVLSYSNCSVSLRSALYQHLRLSPKHFPGRLVYARHWCGNSCWWTGLWQWRHCWTCWVWSPFVLIWCSLEFMSSRCLVRAFVVVVISSIYALIGGRCCLLFSPPITHQDAQIMSTNNEKKKTKEKQEAARCC